MMLMVSDELSAVTGVDSGGNLRSGRSGAEISKKGDAGLLAV